MTTKDKDEVYLILGDNYIDWEEGNLDEDIMVDMVNRLFKAAKQNPAFKTAVAARRADIEEEVRKYQQQDNEQSSKKKQSKKLLG